MTGAREERHLCTNPDSAWYGLWRSGPRPKPLCELSVEECLPTAAESHWNGLSAAERAEVRRTFDWNDERYASVKDYAYAIKDGAL